MFICLKGTINKNRVFEGDSHHFQILLPSRLKFDNWDKEIYAQIRVIGKNYILDDYLNV